MPLIEDVLNQFGHSKWFSMLDLQSRFWQIPMASDDVRKIAVITKSGLYEWMLCHSDLKTPLVHFHKPWLTYSRNGLTNL